MGCSVGILLVVVRLVACFCLGSVLVDGVYASARCDTEIEVILAELLVLLVGQVRAVFSLVVANEIVLSIRREAVRG